MENSASQENAKQQQASDKHLNIETVTPDTENVHPLSRQESPEELQGTTATSADSSPRTDSYDQDNNEQAAEPEEENTEISVHETGKSKQSEDQTTPENKTDDPGAEIETVSP